MTKKQYLIIISGLLLSLLMGLCMLFLTMFGESAKQIENLGATLTTITSTDKIEDFPAVYNANLEELNNAKLEASDYYSTTTHAHISSLPSLLITESQISDLGAHTTSLDYLSQISDVSTTTLAAGYVLKYSGSEWESVATSALGIIGAGGGSGTVTSVAMTVPTGLSISGSPITDSGTLALTFTGGYNIPLTASTTNWNTAYNWGDHSGEGYLVSADIDTLAELNALMGETIASTTANLSVFTNDAGFITASTTNLTASGNIWAATFIGNLTGNVTGNASTASALAANGANCNAGNAPLGIDASGAVESCFDVWTEAENTSADYKSFNTLAELNAIMGETVASTTHIWADAYVEDNLTVTGYMQDGDIDTFSELNSWVTDATLLKSGGTLTEAKYCTWDGTGIDCNSDVGEGGTTYTATGTLLNLAGTAFSLNEGTLTNSKYCTYVSGTGIVCDSEGGTQLTEEEVEDYVGGMLTGNTETLITVTYQDADGTIDFVVDEASINHDSLTGFVANEHIDWTSDQGATNIHSGNYTDTNTTYTGGDFLTLTGTDFDVDTAAVTNGDTTHLSTADAIYDWGVGAFQPLESTLTDIADGTISENLVNTAYPWADDEVADNITASNYLALTAWYSTTTDQLTEGSVNLYQDSELTNWIDDVVLGSSGALTLPSGQNFTIGVIQWNSGDYIDGENIKDDTIDNDSIDWADMTDLTTDGAVSWGNMLWTEIDSYPDACASGVVTGIGDTLTCTDTYMQDEDINTIAELNSWVTDATLLISGGTLTSGKICRYDGTGIDCDYTDQTGGGGGSSVWATSTGLYYNNEGNQFLIGDSSTSSDSILEVKGAITTDGLTVDDGTTSATSTLELGAETNISCLKMRDTDRDGWTYITVLNGVLYVSTTSCEE